MRKNTIVGVIIGRFQAPELHAGHRYVFDCVREYCSDLLVVIGSPRSYPTPKNPLDFETRKAMIKKAYPNARIVELKDQRHDDVWSQMLDQLIEREFPGRDARLYGSRDSFIPYYFGDRPCTALDSPMSDLSATDIRADILAKPHDTEEFRSGMIYAVGNRKPVSYQTVDIAVIDFDRKRLLLGGRAPEKGLLRFIGGFVDVSDKSLELAAKREVFEETNGIEIDDLSYLGSFRIDDWRYRDSQDGIMTTFFTARFIFGAPRPTDDIDVIEWVPWDGFVDRLVDEHKPLGEKLTAYLTGLEPTKGV